MGLSPPPPTSAVYGESLIPGLLQTREYARALYRLGGMLSEEERERALAVRCAGPNGG
ncbi:Scr1 family TA system antitoxin-like transcriptional regulator [Micromonospora chokoriensis]